MFRKIRLQHITTKNLTSATCQRAFSTNFVKPNRPLNILFFGSSDVAVPTLKALAEARNTMTPEGYPLIGNIEVVVPPLRTKGKKLALTESDVEQCAESLQLPIHRLDASMGFKMNGFELPSTTTTTPFDLGVVISFGYKLPEHIINSIPMTMINAHASVLPCFRGAAPIQYALMHNLPETGVTVTTLHPLTIDAGKILSSSPIPITLEDTFTTLAAKVAETASVCIVDTITRWNTLYPNAVEQGTLPPPPPHWAKAPKIKKEQGELVWTKKSAKDLFGVWRGLHGFTSVYTFYQNNIRTEILEMKPVEGGIHAYESLKQPGEFMYDAAQNCLVVRTAEGGVVGVTKLQLACKKPTSAKDFYNGYLKKKNLTQDTFTVAT